jgi:hypothetical protein
MAEAAVDFAFSKLNRCCNPLLPHRFPENQHPLFSTTLYLRPDAAARSGSGRTFHHMTTGPYHE